MMERFMIEIDPYLSIPEREIRFTFTTSGGPGGQNVNKVCTKATLLFDVDGSPSLDEGRKRLLRSRLPGRINQQGVMRVSSQRFRTREANRKAAVARFSELLREALEKRAPRKRTAAPGRSAERRIADKKRRGRLKLDRTRPKAGDE